MSDHRMCTSWTNLMASGGPAAASVAGQLAVGDRVRAGGFRPEQLDLVLLVAVEVDLEPEPLRRVVRRALPRQDVRRDAVEEPAVVRGDDGAAGELEQRVLQRAE